MLLETWTCRWMGTGRPDGPCDFSGPPQTGDPVAFPLSTGSLAKFIIDGNLCGRVHVASSRRLWESCS